MKVIVVMPAYNAEKTLERTYNDIPKEAVDEIILCDDGSSDKTVQVAKSLGIEVIVHPANRGYGANQKTLYREALKKGADIIIMLHPDYQYDARLIPVMVYLLKLDICDVILGSRIRTRKEAIGGGMPLYKYYANRFLTIIENIVLGQNLGEFHSGLRAFSRKVLEVIPWDNNSNDFIFDQEILFQAIQHKFRLADIPTPVRYFKEASSINFSKSLIYGIKTILLLIKYILNNILDVLFYFRR